MANVYPGTLNAFTNPAGTNTLDSPPHADQHSDINDAQEAVESVLGTTGGTSVLKNFQAGNFPVRINTGGTILDSLTGGTLTSTSLVNPLGTFSGGTIAFKNMPYGVVVASAGSGLKGDFVCDGVADQLEIGSAIAQAGGTLSVILTGGTFTVSAPIELMNNTYLYGQGVGVTVIRQANSANDNVLYGTSRTDIQVSNLSIDGNKSNNASGDNGLYLDGCTRFKIFNVESYNNNLKGFVVGSDTGATNDGIFDQWEAHNNNQDGLALASGTANLCSRIQVVNGNSHDNTLYGIGLVVPTADYLQTQNILIMGNTVKDNGSYGIEVFGAKGARIIGNHVERSGNHGIDLGSTGGGTTVAFYVNNSIIMGNVIKNQAAAGYSGIQMQAVYNSIITGNEIFDDQGTVNTAYGILYNSGTGNRVLNNQVRNATTSTAQVYGVDGNGGAANVYSLVNPFSGNGTIDVAGVENLRLSFATAGTILAFTNSYPGQVLRIHTTTANLQIPDSGNFNLNGNFNASDADVLTIYSTNGTSWVEVSRSTN